MEIVWEDRAVFDLQNAISYIALHSPKNAEMVLDELVKLSETLSNMPYKFPKEPYYNKENIRFVSKWSFKIIYQIEKEMIIVLRIFSTHQNPLN
jgi:toxin ParE1/3/4